MLDRERALALALRQRELVLHSALLRGELLQDLQALEAPLSVVDRVQEGWAWLRANPGVPLAALLVLMLLRPRRVLRWSAKIWWGWRLWRRFLPMLATVQAAAAGSARPRRPS
jgi:hypothetical protein